MKTTACFRSKGTNFEQNKHSDEEQTPEMFWNNEVFLLWAAFKINDKIKMLWLNHVTISFFRTWLQNERIRPKSSNPLILHDCCKHVWWTVQIQNVDPISVQSIRLVPPASPCDIFVEWACSTLDLRQIRKIKGTIFILIDFLNPIRLEILPWSSCGAGEVEAHLRDKCCMEEKITAALFLSRKAL